MQTFIKYRKNDNAITTTLTPVQSINMKTCWCVDKYWVIKWLLIMRWKIITNLFLAVPFAQNILCYHNNVNNFAGLIQNFVEINTYKIMLCDNYNNVVSILRSALTITK